VAIFRRASTRVVKVRHVYALCPLTQAVVTALNADLAVKDLADDLAAARYPSVAS
jgi:hypothetical protein